MRLKWLLAVAALSACTMGPNNGTAVDGLVVGKTFDYYGFTDTPGETVTLQVLSDPSANPGLATSWVAFATTTTDTAPTQIGPSGSSPAYYWTVTAAPVPSAAYATRWPTGGVVRTRAIHSSNGGILTTFDEPSFDCIYDHYGSGEDWQTIGLACAGISNTGSSTQRYAGGHVGFASTASAPQGLQWLGFKGDISAIETITYYNTWGAPTGLASFRSTYGFPTGEVTATYYNDGDLGIGREMHCRSYNNGASSNGTACYVTNYSGVSGQARFDQPVAAVLADAVARTHAFATVAMVYNAANNSTNFVVYDNAGARVNEAQLDSTGNHKSIPNNCLACHGLTAIYSSTTHTITDTFASAGHPPAHFLPFDPGSFKYSSASTFTRASQEEAFRKLNQIVLASGPSPAIADFANNIYAPGSVSTTGSVSHDDYLPSGWTTTAQDGHTMYFGVAQKYCRGCHQSANNPAEDFLQLSDWDAVLGTVRSFVCGSGHAMPQAEHVAKNFWNSGARALVVSWTQSAVTAFPDSQAACKP